MADRCAEPGPIYSVVARRKCQARRGFGIAKVDTLGMVIGVPGLDCSALVVDGWNG
jgi:hypothetical protein